VFNKRAHSEADERVHTQCQPGTNAAMTLTDGP